MSAWVVSYNHINSIVAWAVSNRVLYKDVTPDQLGQLLWDENVKSVNYRYNKDDKAKTFKFNPRTAKQLTIVEFLKSLQCLDYQSCEHDGWEKSEAYKWVRNLTASAITKLPGYENAPWGID